MSTPAKNLFIAPSNVKSGFVYQIQLGEKQKFFLINNDQIFLIQQTKVFGSSLIDNYLSSSTTICMLIQFDPIFLLLSSLLKKPDVFCLLEDILVDNNLAHIKELRRSFLMIDKITDVKCHENNFYLRINQEKLREWVSQKFESVFREVALRVPWADRTYDNGEMAKKVSMGILLEFMNKDLVLSLDSRYSLEMILTAGKILNEKKPLPAEIKNFDSSKKLPKKPDPPKLDKNQKTLSAFFGKKK